MLLIFRDQLKGVDCVQGQNLSFSIDNPINTGLADSKSDIQASRSIKVIDTDAI